MNQNIKRALMVVGVTFVITATVVAARFAGLIDSDLSQRIIMAFIGLMVAWYGNMAPKERPAHTARRIAIRRVVGYAVALAGLVNAAIWVWAPMSIAAELSMVPLAGAFVVVLSYCFWLRRPAAPA